MRLFVFGVVMLLAGCHRQRVDSIVLPSEVMPGPGWCPTRVVLKRGPFVCWEWKEPNNLVCANTATRKYVAVPKEARENLKRMPECNQSDGSVRSE